MHKFCLEDASIVSVSVSVSEYVCVCVCVCVWKGRSQLIIRSCFFSVRTMDVSFSPSSSRDFLFYFLVMCS